MVHRISCVVFALVLLAGSAAAQSAKYTFNSQELAVVTTWLFEPFGYLDAAKNEACVSARDALAATPTLNVTQWIRDNTMGCGTILSDWNETAMIWWMRANSGVNITPANRPPEAAAWDAILASWGVTLDDALARHSAITRNQNGCVITTYDSTSAVSGSIPCGNQLLAQSSLVTKVRGVLQA